MKTDGTTIWAEFRRGLSQPSIIACAGMLAVLVATAAAAILLVTPRNVASMNPGLLMSDPYDGYALLTCRALAAQRGGLPPDAVVLVGTSALEYAVSSEAELGGIIGRVAGRDVHAEVLAGPAMTLWEFAALVENLPDGFHGDLVVCLTPLSLAADAAEFRRLATSFRLGFDSPYVRTKAGEFGLPLPRTTGIYFLDQAPFFAARLGSIRNLVLGPTRVGRKYDDRPQLPDPSRQERLARNLTAQLERLAPRGNLGISALEDVVRIARGRGARSVVVVNNVLNPEMVSLLPPKPLQECRDLLRRFSEAQKVEVWDLDEEVDAQPEEFYDWVHLRPEGARARFTAALGKRLGDMLRAEGRP